MYKIEDIEIIEGYELLFFRIFFIIKYSIVISAVS